MDIHVGNHALAGKLLPHKILHQPFTLLVGQLMWERNSDFAGKLGAVGAVALILAALDMVPELFSVLRPFGCVLRRENAGELNAAHAAVIFVDAGALVFKLGAGIVGGLGDGTLPLSPRNHMDV